jgi:hypothetical protein
MRAGRTPLGSPRDLQSGSSRTLQAPPTSYSPPKREATGAQPQATAARPPNPVLQAAAASPLQGFVQTEARGVSGYTRLAGDETEGEACGSQKPRPSQGERGVLPMKRYSSAGGDDSFSRRTGSNLDEESFKLRAEIAPLAARPQDTSARTSGTFRGCARTSAAAGPHFISCSTGKEARCAP